MISQMIRCGYIEIRIADESFQAEHQLTYISRELSLGWGCCRGLAVSSKKRVCINRLGNVQ